MRQNPEVNKLALTGIILFLAPMIIYSLLGLVSLGCLLPALFGFNFDTEIIHKLFFIGAPYSFIISAVAIGLGLLIYTFDQFYYSQKNTNENINSNVNIIIEKKVLEQHEIVAVHEINNKNIIEKNKKNEAVINSNVPPGFKTMGRPSLLSQIEKENK